MARHVGFSGTREGMSASQIWKIDELLQDDLTTQFGHHGDCIGADVDFHRIARANGIHLIGHPPINNALRAFCDFDECREPKIYLERDHDIVDETDWMLFTPGGFREILRSGTWATIRYAKKTGKEGWIVWPDGKVSSLEEWKSVFLRKL